MQGEAPNIFYPIGRHGQPWNEEEFKAWSSAQGNVKRSYKEEVLDKINNIESKISKLEKDISVIDIALENDYEKTIAQADFFSKYEKMKNELGDLMKKWEYLTTKLE